MQKGEVTLKDRIRKIRKELKLTQQEFASRIGTSQNVLANYETGRRNPSASVINNICKTFHINEIWLRTGEGERFLLADTESQLIEWAKTILNEKDTSFKKRFVTMLMAFDENKWKLLEELLQKTVGLFHDQPPIEEEFTVSQAEAEYIKSRSKNARNTALPVSNITKGSAIPNPKTTKASNQ